MHLLSFLSAHTSNSYSAGRATGLVMLVAFLLTFVFARTYTRIARVRGWRSALIAGVHTHHLVFGLIIAFFAGALEFTILPHNVFVRSILAALFGGGAALVLDEFALAVHLQDVYWEKAGRKSVDAVIIAAIFGLFFVLHTVPFGRSADLPSDILALYMLLNLIFVFGAALKGKLFFATFGVFIPIIGIWGALRLAEPDSIWATRFYKPNSAKLHAAQKRYVEFDKIWQPRRDFIWDLVGGKTGRPRRTRHQRR